MDDFKLAKERMRMETLAYYNGRIDEIDKLTVPFNDRSHWFGDGVYDATCAANHVIFALGEHIDRFFTSADGVGIVLGISKQQLRALLQNLCKKVDSPCQLVYWQATRGGLTPRKHTFPRVGAPGQNDQPDGQAAPAANIWASIVPTELSYAGMKKKLSLLSVEDTRYLHCGIKTLNLLPNVLAAERAQQAGCDEAVFHRGGRVAEGSHSNISILKDGVFRTAPTDNLILPGVARAHLIRYCAELGIPVDETAFTIDDLLCADEAILSSASKFCMAISSVDGRPVGGRAPELLGRLQDTAAAHFMKETGYATFRQ